MYYISNAFSLNMLVDKKCQLDIAPLTLVDAKRIAENFSAISVVGHQDTANLFSNLLEIEIPFNRTSLKLFPGDVLIVGQYSGTRLPEGISTLPDGATIEWLLVCL